MADELAGGKAGVEVPETEGLVPRRREGELAVRRDHDVRDEVVVAVEDLLGEAERALLARKLPDDDGLVCTVVSISLSQNCVFSAVLTTRSGEDHVRVLRRGGNGGDPAGVAGKGSLEGKRLAHFCDVG